MSEMLVSLKPRTSSPLILFAIAAWLGVAAVSRGMGSMSGTMGLGVVAFGAVWALMMAAMMLPAVTPFASVYARTFRERRAPRTIAFVSGYLTIWIAAGLPAYALARIADQVATDHAAGARLLAVLAFASCGVYQLTTLKDRCLAWCRSPLGFTVKYSGYRGRTRDLRVGMHHGAFCLGCCWALMVLLLAFGLMNLAAMAVLAFVVLGERTWSWGPRLGRLAGVAALVLAVAVVFHPGLAPALRQSPHTTMTMGM